MQEVSIIILTFNSSRFIENLLKSLKEIAKNSEIIVVDNASSDDTVKIAKKHENVKVIETGKNFGFAKGINFGADKATGKYLLFLNPDTVFKRGNLKQMIEIFEKNEKVGIVGGKLINHDENSEKSAGKFFNFLETILIVLGLDEKFGVRFSPKKIVKVDFVSGGFMMVNSEMFKKLKGFDENFFMYIEDMELCFRAKKAGYDTYFTPEVIISHTGQGSSNRGFAVVNIYKGILYFFRKHKNPFEFYLIKTALYLKAISVYLLGLIMNNSYYKNTYKDALSAIR